MNITESRRNFRRTSCDLRILGRRPGRRWGRISYNGGIRYGDLRLMSDTDVASWKHSPVLLSKEIKLIVNLTRCQAQGVIERDSDGLGFLPYSAISRFETLGRHILSTLVFALTNSIRHQPLFKCCELGSVFPQLGHLRQHPTHALLLNVWGWWMSRTTRVRIPSTAPTPQAHHPAK